MKNNQQTPLLESLAEDESLRIVRKAYHELEASRLSEEHLATKALLKQQIPQPHPPQNKEKNNS